MPLINLVPVDVKIVSSYDKSGKTGGPRGDLIPLSKLGKAGIAHPDMTAALLKLSDSVASIGGDFRVTECHRDFSVQAAARKKYENWVSAGKPKPGSSNWDQKSMKNAFVAEAGRSGHNAGRSIDIHIGMLKFPGVSSDRQLDRLWDVAIPLGWSPVIKVADEKASESWHFDFVGDLGGVRARLGYEQWALCGAILVGHADLKGYEAELQALLCRAGFNIGQIDGQAGPKTQAALASALGISASAAAALIVAKDETIFPTLLVMPAK